MEILEKYNAALDRQAAEFLEKADRAGRQGDERERSLALMQAGMLGETLKMLGKAERRGARPGVFQATVDLLEAKRDAEANKGDYDAADRFDHQAKITRWALATLRRLEAEHE